MLSTILTLFVFATQGSVPTTICPVGLHEPEGAGIPYLYAGVQYTLCCEGCTSRFEGDPAKYVKDFKGEGLIGLAQFDVIARRRIDPKKATIYSDYNHVRYFFFSEENKNAFCADPKKASAAPAKEVLDKCPVMGSAINVAKTPDYVDYNGVRYYFCCPGCSSRFAREPAKYEAKVEPANAKAHKLK